MPEKNLIQIYSQYHDLASPEIKKGMGAIRNEVVITVKEFDSLRRSVSTHMGLFRKEVKQAMEESIKHQKVHTVETARHARTLGFEIGKLAGVIGSIRNLILVWMFALRPLIQLTKESIGAFIEQEDALKRINYAMGLQGTYSKEMSDNLVNLSKGFQSVTRYGDEAVLEVMEKLLTIGRVMPTQLERVTQATLDFASATGKDLATSADIMAKAASGYTAQLSRYGIIIDKNISDTEKFNEVLKFVETRMGKRAQKDIESFGGQLTQTKNAFNDAMEATGLWITKLTQLEKILPHIKDFFAGISERMTIPTTDLEKVTKELKNINNELNLLGVKEPRKIFGIELPGWLAAENALLTKRKELEIKQTKLIAEERAKQEILNIKANEEKIAQAKFAVQEDWEEKYLSFQRTRASFRLSELQKEYKTYQDAFQNNKEALLQIDEWYSYEKRNLDLELLKEAKKHSDLYVQFMAAAAGGMKKALSDGFIKVIKGEFEGLKDVVIDFGNTMLEVIMQAAAVKIIGKTALAAFLGVHTGGYLMSLENSYGYRKKFHSGGEVPATLLEGEGVLNRRGMRSLGVDNLNKLNRGEQAGGGTVINNYYIQTIDERSFRERLQQHGDIYASASEGAIRDNQSLRSTSQRWG